MFGRRFNQDSDDHDDEDNDDDAKWWWTSSPFGSHSLTARKCC